MTGVHRRRCQGEVRAVTQFLVLGVFTAGLRSVLFVFWDDPDSLLLEVKALRRPLAAGFVFRLLPKFL
jgi:hypothetical protein